MRAKEGLMTKAEQSPAEQMLAYYLDAVLQEINITRYIEEITIAEH